MQDHFPARRFPFNLDLVLRRGLGRTLLLSFLALAMVPMALVGAISYHLTGNHLTQEISEKSTVDTDQTRRWREHLNVSNAGRSLPVPFAYAGPDGNLVIGTHAGVRLGDTPYALIVEVDQQAAFAALNRFRGIVATAVILVGVGALVVATILARAVIVPVRELSQKALKVAEGGLDDEIRVTASNEIGELAAAFGSMIRHFKAVKTENDNQSRLISGLARLSRLIGGDQKPGNLCLNTLEFLFDFLALHQADFYIVNSKGRPRCIGRLPGQPDASRGQIVHPENGRVSQAALEKTIIAIRKEPESELMTPVPATDTAHLIAVPLVLHQTVKGVLELEKTDGFNRFDLWFLEAVAEVVAVALNTALTRQQEETLLEGTRQHAETLQVRKAELEVKTRELLTQRRASQTSEQKLHLKQLELEAANAQMVKSASDLEAHMSILEKQKLDIKVQNTELEKTHRELEEKARQLEASSRYKTEFMANMSHELRTPLNSILLLSRLLLENKEKTLTDKQSEFAQTIHSAGDDLLNLINEILDLAKVESGKMEVVNEAVQIRSIVHAMQVSFTPLAEQSGIAFTIHVSPDTPDQLLTDRKRIQQIVKNFLSNAFKFTPRGTIRLEIDAGTDLPASQNPGRNPNTGNLTISVVDTGIGIPADKHQMVFEAFQQVDGSTRRKYEGTGLGLSISRELARMLGGEITLESKAGQGSRFTLHLPLTPLRVETPAALPIDALTTTTRPTAGAPRADKTEAMKGGEPIPDDRRRLSPEALNDVHLDRLQAMDARQSVMKGRKVLLVDDDMRTVFAVTNVLEDQGAEVLTGKTGKESLDKLGAFPDIDLILMDVMIAEVNGYQAIREIRNRDRYRTLPIIALTSKAMKGDRSKCIEAGADDYLAKPVNLDKLKSMLKVWLDPQLAFPKTIGV